MKIIDLIDNKNKRIIGAFVDDTIRSLNYDLPDNKEFKPIDVDSNDGNRIYKATLRLIIAYAVNKLFKDATLTISNSISRSYFIGINLKNRDFGSNDYKKLKAFISKTIKNDIPIITHILKKDEVIKILTQMKDYEKINILNKVDIEYVPLFEIDGFYDLLYYVLAPSTGYISEYKIRRYQNGLLVSYPRVDLKGELPEFQKERLYLKALKESYDWSHLTNTTLIEEMNEMIRDGKARDLVNICEARHNIQFTHLGDKIEKNIDKIRLICLAGPSSSSKTTSTNRLKVELMARGIRPLVLGLDDFYKDKDDGYPKDEDGNYDYEHIDGIDLELFNDTIFKLLNGIETRLPKFKFNPKERYFTEPVHLDDDQIIIIEGLHALNPKIASTIPDDKKFKIYISPIGEARIDSHTPITISDIRLIRRLVRDFRDRNFNIEETLDIWASVRSGEFKWVYPFIKNADYIFNTELRYELFALKKHALPLLKEVKPNSKHYSQIRRLIEILNLHLDISDKLVPNNSILREFIGDSVFYSKD